MQSIRIDSRQKGFLKLPNDNIVKTIGVALLLCLVCSIIVSGAAVTLKPTQLANNLLDKKRNILTVAGITDESKTVDELFAQIETKVIDLQTGEFTDAFDVDTFDQLRASKQPATRVELSKEQDIAKIGGRSKFANIYFVQDAGEVAKIILPIKGYGLWSTMYGFLALEADAQTVSGITFYDHAETPGLGGEIDNKKWQSSWQGKQLMGADGQVALGLIKGTVSQNTQNPEYKIDGLAGASLTSNGVTNLIRFWLGENGFGPYLEGVRSGNLNVRSNNLNIRSSNLNIRSSNLNVRSSSVKTSKQAQVTSNFDDAVVRSDLNSTQNFRD